MTAPHQESAAPMGNNPGEMLRIAREDRSWPLSDWSPRQRLAQRPVSAVALVASSSVAG